MPILSSVRSHLLPGARTLLAAMVPWLIFAGGLYLVSLYSYLLFHSLAELFSIAVGTAVFMLAWNTRRFMTNDFLFFISVSYLFAGSIDLFHTLAYKGMGIFPSDDANLPTQLWIAARYLQSFSFLSAVLLIRRRIDHRLLLSILLAATLLLLLAIASGVFPDCYVNGLTPFKKVSEYIISLVFAASILRLRREREAFIPRIHALITLSIAFTILSELAFTFYIDVYGLSNFLGHIFKIFALYYIYKSVIETGLNQPFDLLFHSMKKRESELENSQKLLHEAATHDPLTGLPNRYLFDARLTHAIEKCQRNNYAGPKCMVQLIIMDVDDFKDVNDRFGHLCGDEVLKEIGRRLKAAIRESDAAVRWGGDEFTCILEDIAGSEAATKVAQKILTSMAVPIRVQGQELNVTVSLGFSLFPNHGGDGETLLRNADAALYHAKKRKNSFRMYEESMNVFNASLFNKSAEE